MNDALLLGTGTIAATGVTPSPSGGVAASWTLGWPEQEHAGIEPITLQAVYGTGLPHPHLRGGTEADWPLTVFTDAYAAAELPTLRTNSAADLHNPGFQRG